jgi:hypothetical protein
MEFVKEFLRKQGVRRQESGDRRKRPREKQIADYGIGMCDVRC